MLPATADRIGINTDDEINEQIRRQADARVTQAAAGGTRAVDRRLVELDYEWDVERMLETMAPSMSLVGLFLGAMVNRKWLLLPAGIQAFLLLHGVQGWCPPLPALRRMGFRSLDEINQERYALKAVRGDFRESGRKPTANEAIAATRK